VAANRGAGGGGGGVGCLVLQGAPCNLAAGHLVSPPVACAAPP
jgi:hypothetical protein